MRIGVFIEPIFQQKAGIHQFTKQMVNAIEVHGNLEYVLIGSKKHHSKLVQHLHSRASASFTHPKRWLGNRNTLVNSLKLDLFIDPSHFGSLGLLPASKRIAIVHDITPTLFPQLHRTKTVIGHRLFMKKWIEHSRAVIAVSQQTKNDIERVFQPKTTPINIYPGSELLKVTQPLKYTDRFFLSVGSAEPRKNLSAVVTAFERLNDPDVQLRIVGPDGWKLNLPQVVAASPARDRIEMMGFVSREELAALYSSAIGLVYPSLYEGFGFPAVEAMALGCPVITSNVGGTNEVCGSAALKVNPREVSEIQDAMETLIGDKERRLQLIQAGREQATKYDWRSFVAELENVINALPQS